MSLFDRMKKLIGDVMSIKSERVVPPPRSAASLKSEVKQFQEMMAKAYTALEKRKMEEAIANTALKKQEMEEGRKNFMKWLGMEEPTGDVVADMKKLYFQSEWFREEYLHQELGMARIEYEFPDETHNVIDPAKAAKWDERRGRINEIHESGRIAEADLDPGILKTLELQIWGQEQENWEKHMSKKTPWSECYCEAYGLKYLGDPDPDAAIEDMGRREVDCPEWDLLDEADKRFKKKEEVAEHNNLKQQLTAVIDAAKANLVSAPEEKVTAGLRMR